MTITKACVDCKEQFTFDVPDREWMSWKSGELAQNAMPSVPEDLRELLISGICGCCFDALFASEVYE